MGSMTELSVPEDYTTYSPDHFTVPLSEENLGRDYRVSIFLTSARFVEPSRKGVKPDPYEGVSDRAKKLLEVLRPGAKLDIDPDFEPLVARAAERLAKPLSAKEMEACIDSFVETSASLND